jgi:hypothetical protein
VGCVREGVCRCCCWSLDFRNGVDDFARARSFEGSNRGVTFCWLGATPESRPETFDEAQKADDTDDTNVAKMRHKVCENL